MRPAQACPSTFSIVAVDPLRGEAGVAVASKFLAVGALVPWARAGVGAVATQALANVAFGPRGLELLASGLSAREALKRLLATDEQREHRQVGIVDARGNAGTHTGSQCYAWAGGLAGEGFACQGNILAGEETVQAMAASYRQPQGELSQRLLAALQAGQEAGGDSRGQQSAALLVVREKGGYGGFTDRYMDLRVDDHPAPLSELARLVELHNLYFGKSRPEDLLPVDALLTAELQRLLAALGHYRGEVSGVYDEATRDALTTFSHRENLEERLRQDDLLDQVVLRFLREQASSLR